jgi:hypothetical protein
VKMLYGYAFPRGGESDVFLKFSAGREDAVAAPDDTSKIVQTICRNHASLYNF